MTGTEELQHAYLSDLKSERTGTNIFETVTKELTKLIEVLNPKDNEPHKIL